MNRDNRFLRNEYLRNLFPVLFSVLGGTINTLIDGVFVSQRLGSAGLAAVNISMPVYLVICTFGSLIAGGASVMSAQSAGNEQMEEAEKHYHTAISICLLFGLLFTIAGCIFCSPISNLLSQGGDMNQYVYPYCLITMIGIIPTAFSYLPLNYLQLEGKTRAITVTMVLMIVMDISFDYIFMFLFDFGISGAALASLISIVVSCFYGFFELERGYSNYHFRLIKPKFSISKEIVRYGSPAALGNFVDAVKLLLLNTIILRTGGASASAVWAILNSLSELSISITSGVPRAATPMMGAYFASRENSGLRILMRLQVQLGLLLSISFSVILIILSDFLKVVFSANESLLIPLICLGFFVVFDLLASIWMTFFHATGRLMISNIFVIMRKLVFPVGFAAFFMLINGYLWLFLPLGGFFTILAGMIMTGIVYIRNKKTDHPLSRAMLLDDYLEREKKVLDFSIAPNAEDICNASEQIKDFCMENNMGAKQTMKLQLSIEELLTVIVQKNENLHSVDLRAFALDGTTGIRIRCAGKYYNPFEQDTEEDDDFMMGINMMKKMAETVSFTYTLGMNIINIMFRLE